MCSDRRALERARLLPSAQAPGLPEAWQEAPAYRACRALCLPWTTLRLPGGRQLVPASA